MKNQRAKLLLQVLVIVLIGLLVSRFILDEKLNLYNFYKSFDVLMHIVIIVGLSMVVLGIREKDRKKDNNLKRKKSLRLV